MEKVKDIDIRTIFAGDDTGLLKKVRLTFKIDQIVISEPNKSRRNKNKRTLEEAQVEGEEDPAKDIFAEEEKALIRERPDVSMKLIGKSGSQAKDEGIKHLCWSLGTSQNDYVSYVRGKSNIVQVFDTRTENVFKEKQYKSLAPIKGLVPLGNDIFALK